VVSVFSLRIAITWLKKKSSIEISLEVEPKISDKGKEREIDFESEKKRKDYNKGRK